MTSNTPPDSRLVGSLRSDAGAGVVRLEASFDTPVDDLWSAFTDPGRLSQWLGDLDGDLHAGGEFRASFSATGWEGTCRVEVCQPPEQLLIRTRADDEPDCVIEVTLQADDERTTLVFEDRGLPLDKIAAYGAGDHVLLEGLAAHLAGTDRADTQARWGELLPTYRERAAALA